MTLPENKVHFAVGLSNGDNLIEGEGILLKVDGEDSPWHKLQKYIQDKDLEIRSMSLYSKTEVGNRHYHLPNASPKFKGEAPKGFKFFRWVAMEGLAGETLVEHYAVAEAIFEDYKAQLWVSELDPDKCWVNLVQNKGGRKETAGS
jgi:hypothetical protein